MSIASVMDGLAGVVATIDGYDYSQNGNVAVSDNRVLNAGPAKCAVIWRSPGSRRQDITLGNPKTVQNSWQIGIDVYCLTSGDPQGVSGVLEVEVNLILDAISNYPNLNGTPGVIYAIADVPEDMQTAQVPNSNYYKQSIHVEVRELEQVSVLESAGA